MSRPGGAAHREETQWLLGEMAIGMFGTGLREHVLGLQGAVEHLLAAAAERAAEDVVVPLSSFEIQTTCSPVGESCHDQIFSLGPSRLSLTFSGNDGWFRSVEIVVAGLDGIAELDDHPLRRR